MLDAANASSVVDEAASDDLPAAYRITIEHTFETAHRLPQLGGKCTSLHGHSWSVAVSVLARSLGIADMTVVEFGALKAGIRHWIDTHLDHGSMLGARDPLIQPLLATGCKIYRFGGEGAAVTEAEFLATDLAWPTVEAVAVLLWRVSQRVLDGLTQACDVRMGRVFVRETRVNSADYGQADAT